MSEPTRIVPGDTLQWETYLPAYLPTAGWMLAYYLRGPAYIDISTTQNGDNHAVNVAAVVTVDYTPGDYWWFARVKKGTETYKVLNGEITVERNLEQVSGVFDGRSHVKKVLDAIEAVIEGRAGIDQMGMSVNGRQISRTPIPELLVLRDRYKSEYRRETDLARIKKGLGTSRKIQVRF